MYEAGGATSVPGPSGGNQVDGLPPDVHTGLGNIGFQRGFHLNPTKTFFLKMCSVRLLQFQELSLTELKTIYLSFDFTTYHA